MVEPRALASCFEACGEWRRRLADGTSALHTWLSEHDLADAAVDLDVEALLLRLRENRLTVAVAADFSRGKSELINALFFADRGASLLPATAGRATSCPAEFLHDASRPPSIQLLPIESRLKDSTVEEFRICADEWEMLPLDTGNPAQMGAALARVSETKRVPAALARALGLQDDDDPASADRVKESTDDRVDIPAWRHAIINLPHPLLQQGLVILDTPGLDAVGTEPELARKLLPDAEVVLFILAADAGVTKNDLKLWRRDLAGDNPERRAARLVVLNKIDSLWGGRTPLPQAAARIDRLVEMSTALLGLSPARVLPVSAQKGLLAKQGGDDVLLGHSGLRELEAALAAALLQATHDLYGETTRFAVRAFTTDARQSLEARQTAIAEQLADLRGLRGKNQDMIVHMMARVTEERDLFERGAQRFTALRTVFTQQTSELFDVIGLEKLRANAGRTRRGIERSAFTKGVRGAMTEFFTSIRRDFDDAGRRAVEIHDLMQAMYTRFATEQRAPPFSPPPFSMQKFHAEIDRIERAYNQHFNTLWNMLSKAKFSLTRGFFETVASRVKHVYDTMNNEVEIWLRSVMSPLESHVAEHHLQLRRQLESVKRIHDASGELEARIGAQEEEHQAIAAQIAALKRLVESIDRLVETCAAPPAAATATA